MKNPFFNKENLRDNILKFFKNYYALIFVVFISFLQQLPKCKVVEVFKTISYIIVGVIIFVNFILRRIRKHKSKYK